MADQPQQTTGPVFTWGRLKQCHPRVDLARIRCLHALYRGGHHLLGDQAVMDKVFPRHAHEQTETYNERRSRAFYENLFALVINYISAGLAQDPIRIAVTEGDGDNDEDDKQAEASEDDYWVDLMQNASPPLPYSEVRPLDHVVRSWCVEALVVGWAWMQADMPQPTQGLKSRAEQEAVGDLDAYPCVWPSDCVVDWSEKDGELQWLRTYECKQPDDDPTKPRTLTVHCYTLWTQDGWYQYDVEEDKNPANGKKLPADLDPVAPRYSGAHGFGCVPWVKLDFCKHNEPSLHVGDMIESLCRNYFNRCNGESFQWISTYFQQLYEFLGKELPGIDEPVSEAQQNPGRAQGVRGPNIVQVRGQEDDARYVAPDMTSAEIGHQALKDERDAIMRSTGHMALSQDTSGAMVRRSEGSKKQDAVAQEVLLGAIGKRLLAAAMHAMKMLARGRTGGADDEAAPLLQGYQRFSIQDLDQLIQQMTELEGISIPSATYKIEKTFRLVRTDLGDDVPESVMAKVREELEQSITQEQFLLPPPGTVPPPDEEEEEEEEGDKPPPPPGKSPVPTPPPKKEAA